MYRQIKVCISALLFSLFFECHAQIEKGNMLVGGNVNSAVTYGRGYASATLNIAPGAGYFITNRFAAGASLNLTSVAVMSGPRFHYFTAGIAPFVRYYTSYRLFIFGQPEFESNLTRYKLFKYMNTRIGIGYAAFITESVALEPILFTYPDYIARPHSLTTIGVQAGLQVYISRKKREQQRKQFIEQSIGRKSRVR
jgi:hypothetical protein